MPSPPCWSRTPIPDHAPGARELARDCGVPVYGSGIALAGVSTPGFAPDRVLADGDTLPTDAGPLRALRTPGHAADHICYLLETQRLLFAGDHLMDGTTVVIAPPDGDMAAYLASLAAPATGTGRAYRPRARPADGGCAGHPATGHRPPPGA